MKRLISAFNSEIKKFTKEELLDSIKYSEGRVILSENIVIAQPLVDGITNAELATAMGADMVLLNMFDVFEPSINGLGSGKDIIKQLKNYIAAPVGINLEPVDLSISLKEERSSVSKGRQAIKESFLMANELGVDYICLTGNPQVGVSNSSICSAIKEAKKYFNGLIIAGKMHAAGINESVVNLEVIDSYLKAGADVILLPSLNTVPGISEAELKKAVDFIHTSNALALGAIGTSQEGSKEEVIREIALSNKRVGFDISHIGDCGYFGVALPENILEMSLTIKGRRHTYRKMASSLNR